MTATAIVRGFELEALVVFAIVGAKVLRDARAARPTCGCSSGPVPPSDAKKYGVTWPFSLGHAPFASTGQGSPLASSCITNTS